MSLPALLVAALLAGMLIGGGGAWRVQAWRWAAADAEVQQLQAEAQRMQARTADAAASRHEVERARLAAQQRVITVEVERVVQSPVYRSVCLDDAGLRVVAAAVGAASAAGQSAPAVPAAIDAR